MTRTRRVAQKRRRYGIPTGSYSEGMGVVRGYQSVLRPSPAVPVLLQLPKWAGRQILWQDPAGSIPVEEIGDPEGRADHPLTGEKMVEQTTDSNRPAWGGIGVGADFDGENDYLVSHAIGDLAESITTGPGGFIWHWKWQTDDQVRPGYLGGGSNETRCWYRVAGDAPDDDSMRWECQDTAGNFWRSTSISEYMPRHRWWYMPAFVDGDTEDTIFSMWLDDDIVYEGSVGDATGGDASMPEGYPIGARTDSGSPSEHVDCQIRWVTAYDRVPDDETIIGVQQ